MQHAYHCTTNSIIHRMKQMTPPTTGPTMVLGWFWAGFRRIWRRFKAIYSYAPPGAPYILVLGRRPSRSTCIPNYNTVLKLCLRPHRSLINGPSACMRHRRQKTTDTNPHLHQTHEMVSHPAEPSGKRTIPALGQAEGLHTHTEGECMLNTISYLGLHHGRRPAALTTGRFYRVKVWQDSPLAAQSASQTSFQCILVYSYIFLYLPIYSYIFL